MSTPKTITMYGTTWCSDCLRSKLVLKKYGVAYQFVNIEEDMSAAQTVEELNNGMRSVPTIVFGDKSIMVEPSNAQLKSKLDELGLIDYK